MQTRFPILHHIAPASPLIPFLQLIPSILIFLVDDKYIRAFLTASIGLQLALVLTLHLFSHSLTHIEILPIHNTIRPQFVLSNTSQAQMNTVYHSTPSPWPQSKHLITFPITMIENPIHRQQLLLLQNDTNSRPTATKTRVVNLVAQLKTALHLSYSNSALSQVFSSAALVALLPGNPSTKIKQPKAPVNQKSWPPTNAPLNSSPLNTMKTILGSQKLTLAPKSIMTTRQTFNGRPQ